MAWVRGGSRSFSCVCPTSHFNGRPDLAFARFNGSLFCLLKAVEAACHCCVQGLVANVF